MNAREIRVRRVIDASVAQTFHHWTDSDQRRMWCSPDPSWEAEATSDLRVGGQWSVRFGPDPATMYRVAGVYVEIDAPSRLVYTSVFTYPDRRTYETLTTVTFEPVDAGTLLTFLESGYPADEDMLPFEIGTAAVLDAFDRAMRSTV